MTEPICEVIITADDEDRLINFTRSLVEDRLAACGQHLAPIRSIYRWNGSIHDDREVRVALHTRASLVPAIVDRANLQLSYEVPCVLAFSVETGNSDYLAWVIEQTSEPDADDQA
jgi:periplasmic divalent cation tolerance protein